MNRTKAKVRRQRLPGKKSASASVGTRPDATPPAASGQDQTVGSLSASGQDQTGLDTRTIAAIPVENVGLDDVFPSTQNDAIYSAVDTSNPDFLRLVEKIRQEGILQPLVITSIGEIISGHRRHAAAERIGLSHVPCQRLPVGWADSPDLLMRLLVSFNEQRVKRVDEALREELVGKTFDDVYCEILEFRRQKAGITVATIPIRQRKGRAKISDAKRPMLAAILSILGEERGDWPLSDRQIHYKLASRDVLSNAETGTQYVNDDASYKALTDLLTRARITGEIPMEAIHDPTRMTSNYLTWSSSREYLSSQIDSLLRDYWRDPMQSQRNHIELHVEKHTLLDIAKRVAHPYAIPVSAGKGFASLPCRAQMVERFEKSRKSRLIILFVCDLDPEGTTIPSSFARSLVDDFGIDEFRIKPVRVALTLEQVAKYNLPPLLLAKKSSSNFARFRREYGTDHAYEVEALDTATLKSVIKEAIESVVDRELLNAELVKDREEAAAISRIRQHVGEVLRKIAG